ncbi:uncharacterized protein N7511_003679 [Penicillium nucicola]|uniref:uncharacterized protein n=1 Tax=Penicillium nucicola TaxID=1850975 RepID=UPI002545305A|nr:uncharacterized protein N7511_003679 [Penicillium nucicola]KAJ5766063.1 hypothetical protein N7511_003679 [Penicillium nucicola]
MARPNEDRDVTNSSFLDMRSLLNASPILLQGGPSELFSAEAEVTSPASTTTMANTTETEDENRLMEERRRRQMHFSDTRASHQNSSQARTQAIVRYHRQQGEHSSADIAASSHAEIPMSADRPAQELPMPPSGMTRRTLALPPVNAAGLNHILLQTRAHDPVAQALIWKNTRRLQELGLSYSKVPDDDGETVNMRVRAAHERLQAFMQSLPEDEPYPQPPFGPINPHARHNSPAPPIPLSTTVSAASSATLPSAAPPNRRRRRHRGSRGSRGSRG